jgi:hypothetical protein
VIVAVKKRLDEADRVTKTPSDERGLPGFVNFMIF